MKLTNNRYYFDFNATSPLAKSVKDWLSRGDSFFANPASIHSSGKKAKRLIEETTEFLFETFSLDENEFRVFYHSGATEGINTLIKGRAQLLESRDQKLQFICSSSDHSCVVELEEDLKAQGHHFHAMSVDHQGQLSWSYDFSNQAMLLNGTWGNNETGVVTPLKDFLNWKNQTGGKVHIDAVQSIGKIMGWRELSSQLDAYTFSGHKFGALKGVGFSFVRKDFAFEPLLRGGQQQQGLRSGTQNVEGIYSLKLALEELLEKDSLSELVQARQFIENEIKMGLGAKVEIIGEEAIFRAGNTICLKIDQARADTLLTAFDLAGMDISTGSACSSGAVRPSRVLLAMGYTEQEAKSSIRLSFSPSLTMDQAREFCTKILSVLTRF